MCVKVGPRFKRWQRWDDVNCLTGVAFPMVFQAKFRDETSPRGQSYNVCERSYVWRT